MRVSAAARIILGRMKKKILLSLAILLIVLIGGLFYASMKANDIVAAFKPQIEQQLSTSLGSTVELGEISASVFPSAHISVAGVKVISATPGTAPLSLGGLRASVALLPLLSKKLEINELVVESPNLTFIKDAAGVSIAGIAPKKSGEQQPAPTTQATNTNQKSAMDIQVSRIGITDGTITYDDRTTKSKTTIKKINLDAGVKVQGQEVAVPELDLSLAIEGLLPLTFKGEKITFAQNTGALTIGSLASKMDAGEIHIDGNYVLSTKNGRINVASKGLQLNKVAALLKTSNPHVSAMNLSGSVATSLGIVFAADALPQLQGPIKLDKVGADLPGPTKIREASGEISTRGNGGDISFSTNGISLRVQDAPMFIHAVGTTNQSSVQFTTLTLRMFGGEAKVPTTLQKAPPAPFSTQATIANISLGDLLKAFKPDLGQRFSGILVSSNGSFSGNTGGDLARSLNGRGDLAIKDGILYGVNLPNLILSKVSNIPLLEGTLLANVPPQHQKHFNSPNTQFKDIKANYSMAGGTTTINSLSVVSDAFTLESNGTVSVDGDVNLSSTFFLAPDISKSIGERSKTIRSVLDTTGRLSIPVVIKGRSPALLVLPDVSKLISGAGARIIEEKAGEALRKALGGKDGDKGKKNPLGGILKF